MNDDFNDELGMMNAECDNKHNSAFSTQQSSFNIPAIRFKGFSGEWEESALQSIAEVLDGDRGHNYPNGDDIQATGHTLFLNASNVTANGFKLGVTQYIKEEKSNCMGNGKLVLDDIVLTSRGSVGHVAWYNDNIKQQVPFARINSGMLILRSKGHIAPSIVAQFLKSPAGKKKIDLISFGSAQPQLTKMSVSAYTVTIPSEKTEQTKIGNYFQQLDTLIALHQKKHDKLLNLKKALLEKMFPKQGATVPEIRFKGFGGKWEEKKLCEVCQEFQSGKFIKAEAIKVEGAYPVYGGNGLRGYADSYNYNGIYALIGRQGALCGNMSISTGKAYFTEHAIAVRANNYGDTNFLFYLLGTMSLGQYSGQSAQPGLAVNKLIELTAYFSTPKEQTQIGNLFQKLDTLITQHQAQLKKLGNIKQACLEKMFV